MRYQGQNYEQEVPVPAGALDDDELARRPTSATTSCYHEFYGYRLDGMPVELVRLGRHRRTGEAAAVLRSPPAVHRRRPDAPGERRRDVFFPDGGFQPTPVVAPERAGGPERSAPGPLIVESMDSTVVVPPGWTTRGDASTDLRNSSDET